MSEDLDEKYHKAFVKMSDTLKNALGTDRSDNISQAIENFIDIKLEQFAEHMRLERKLLS